jgi:SAM-dependent methyltransferase
VGLEAACGEGADQGGPWQEDLRRTLGFEEEAWQLAAAELGQVSAAAAQEPEGFAIPAELREGVNCTTGRQCVGELFARLHLLLYASGHLPLRDSIYIGADDPLAPLHVRRANALPGQGDDWAKIMNEHVSGGAERSREEDLDHLMPFAHPLQVDRRQLANFVLDVRDIVTSKPLGRCLEWDQPFFLINAFRRACRWNDLFTYSEPDPDNPWMGLPGRQEYTYGTRHYWGDLEHEEGIGIEPDTFDLILVPFVFEHVSNPFAGMKELARVLRPGGHIIWAAPMFEKYHGSPKDFFRYTPKGAIALAEHAGLEVVKLYAPGDLALVTGTIQGMMLPYWSDQRVLTEEAPKPGDDSPSHPLNVFALMRKTSGS